MREKPTDLAHMIRLALQAQIDLGMGEAVIRPDRQDMTTSLAIPPGGIPASDISNVEEQAAAMTLPTRPTEYESLEVHRSAICDCQRCDLGKTRNKFVYGVGRTDADLLFIGEAPGADEDRLGEPFVGRAGQLLDRILAAIQLSRQEVYIANILKCRPPNNRDPQPDEMEQCFEYLRAQVHLIQPKLICALGRIAAQALLKTTTPLGRLRKKWHEYEGVPLLVTYHPAALLRFQQYKRDTWEDMQMLKARYDSIV
ncbi:MAG: uracil-DNA glycosylase [Candidatus Zixiibacteriota bacterium]